jgi:hypothetical protein
MISKAAWYKEAAGFITVVTWLSIVGLIIYYAVAEVDKVIDWPSLVLLLVIASITSLLRMSSGRVSTEAHDI